MQMDGVDGVFNDNGSYFCNSIIYIKVAPDTDIG